jgi:hypothetical protein
VERLLEENAKLKKQLQQEAAATVRCHCFDILAKVREACDSAQFCAGGENEVDVEEVSVPLIKATKNFDDMMDALRQRLEATNSENAETEQLEKFLEKLGW